MSVIPASSVRVTTMSDGTLRLSVDIEPRDAQAAFRLFGAPGTAIALAALRAGGKQAAPATAEEPKGGTAAKWLGMRCAEPEFQAWLQQRHPLPWGRLSYATSAERAAHVVRLLCGVTSRAEIDHDEQAHRAFQAHIREPWLAHSKAAV
jgi:hypothetical protein